MAFLISSFNGDLIGFISTPLTTSQGFPFPLSLPSWSYEEGVLISVNGDGGALGLGLRSTCGDKDVGIFPVDSMETPCVVRANSPKKCVGTGTMRDWQYKTRKMQEYTYVILLN